jgi:pimeloyl-ACP methyl ester carboxylesterase
MKLRAIKVFSAVMGICFSFPQCGKCQPSPPTTATQAPVQIDTTTGTLHGAVDLPAGRGPFPVVISIAGSGPTDRDGNQPNFKNDSLKMLGQALAARGIAVLRYDRRGIGQSKMPTLKEEDLRFDMLVDDVAGWIRLMRKDKRFGHVGVMGHSEGALVGLLAAKRERVDAYVSLAGAGRKAAEILRKQLGRNLPPALHDQAFPIVAELEAGHTVANIPKELASLFRPSVQPYLISYFKYDPALELGGLLAPTLIVQGTTDLQETVEDAKRLAAGSKNAQLLIVEDMNHTLKHATTLPEQQAAYFDPSVPLSKSLADDVAKFLKGAFSK